VNLITVGLIGYGAWGRKLCHALQRFQFCKIVGITDLDQFRTEIARRETGIGSLALAELLSDASVQLVVVATPPASHYALARSAIEAGKHVYCAKPLATSVEDAQQLLDLAKRTKVLLAVDQVSTFVPGVRRLLETVRSGRIGEPYYAQTTRVNFGSFRRDVDVLWDLAPHDLSILDQLGAGTSPTVNGYLHGGRLGNDISATSHMSLSYASGLEASVFVSWLAQRKFRELLVVGNEGMLSFRETARSASLSFHSRAVFRGALPDAAALLPSVVNADEEIAIDPEEPLLAEFSDIAQRIGLGDLSCRSAEAAIRVIKTLAAVATPPHSR
jgi:predicted dehydrogenase